MAVSSTGWLVDRPLLRESFWSRMQLHGHDIGVCSWSLRDASKAILAPKPMIDAVRALGLQHVHLALVPLMKMDEADRAEAVALLKDSGLTFSAGMLSFEGEDYTSIEALRSTGGFTPAASWPDRRALAVKSLNLARELKILMISAHAGFIPPSDSPSYPTINARLTDLASFFDDAGIDLLLETGQETAPELLQFLNDLSSRNVYCNYDPANMILYGAGDPIDAVRVLGRHIRHVHMKDARASTYPREKWGDEVPLGTGQVGLGRLIEAFAKVGYKGPLLIEAEGMEMGPIEDAIEAIRNAL